MAANIRDFFTYSSLVQNVTEEEYKNIELLVSTVESFARTTYKCVYVIDYFKKEFLYVSDNFAYLCNQSSEKTRELGYRFYTDFVPIEEQKMILEVKEKGFEFFEKIPIEERTDWSITCDFHILNGNHPRLINHTLTPILLSKEGRIWLGLCMISLSARNAPGNIIVKKMNDNNYFEYSLSTHDWTKKEVAKLSRDERDVLILSAQGYTMSEISERIFKSVDTVKSYKRKIFEKFDVNNIAGALVYAINYKLI